MQERRDKGLCYNCDEKYHAGHRCNRPKLYLLEGVEIGGDQEESEEEIEEQEQQIQTAELLVISVHALSGVPSPKTMRLVGNIGNFSVIILIDTGSTHSFVDENVARKIKLPVETSHLAVQVANGTTFPCQGCCKAVFMQMQV